MPSDSGTLPLIRGAEMKVSSLFQADLGKSRYLFILLAWQLDYQRAWRLTAASPAGGAM